MAKNVLITGGSGLVGKNLTRLLIERGYRVAHLSRSFGSVEGVKVYKWDIERGIIDDEALAEADYLVHLAGAGIADERWTEKRKIEIIGSRTKSIELIAKELQGRPYHIKAFVSASAIGFYGADRGDEPLTERSTSGADFLAHVTRSWENAAELIENIGIRTVKFRIGVVLSTEGGALPKIANPIKYGVGAALGTGKQWVSWIHIEDLCNMMIEALENSNWEGVYNAVAPNPVTNSDLTRQIANTLSRPLILPNVPAFTLRMAFGKMADVILGSNKVINERIMKETNFKYNFLDLNSAIDNLF